MAETDLSTISPTVNAGVGPQPRILLDRKTDDGSVNPGAIVQSKSVSDNDVLANAVADPTDWDGAAHRPLGVVYEDGELDIDTVFGTGVPVLISPLGSGDIVYVEISASAGDLIEGDPIYASNSVAGQAVKAVYANVAAPTGDEVVAHHRNYIGRCLEFAADSADTRWVKTLLN